MSFGVCCCSYAQAVASFYDFYLTAKQKTGTVGEVSYRISPLRSVLCFYSLPYSLFSRSHRNQGWEIRTASLIPGKQFLLPPLPATRKTAQTSARRRSQGFYSHSRSSNLFPAVALTLLTVKEGRWYFECGGACCRNEGPVNFNSASTSAYVCFELAITQQQ
jgi:hypothetical protein